jgi:DNA-binding MarR family transcriptional regulator/GNAT superfamily N-acetyltransferase
MNSTNSKKIDNYIQQLPGDSILSIGSLTKRLTDILFMQVQELYDKRGHNFKPVWFSFLLAIYKSNGIDIKSLAASRGVTASSASQVVKDLERNGLVTSLVKEQDTRFMIVRITDKGIEALNKLVPELKHLEDVFGELLGEEKDLILARLRFFEQQLRQKPIHERVSSSIEIRPYSKQDQKDFKHLNLLWLKEYFNLSDYDHKQLDNPQESILEKGGEIFVACENGVVIGTIALLHLNNHDCEISKMTVAKDFRGRNIGKYLLSYAMDRARLNQYQNIILYANHRLESALHIYEKFGFIEIGVDREGMKYGERCDKAYKYSF